MSNVERSFPISNDPYEVLAAAVAVITRDVADLRGTVLARAGAAAPTPALVRTVVEPGRSGSLTAFAAANRAMFIRVLRGGTITKVGFHVGVSAGNVSVAVCRGGTGRAAATTRVATSGSVACPAAGYQEISLGASVDVNAETDWLALSASSTSATFWSTAVGLAGTTSNLALGFYGYEDTAHPVPASPTIATTGATYPILIGVP